MRCSEGEWHREAAQKRLSEMGAARGCQEEEEEGDRATSGETRRELNGTRGSDNNRYGSMRLRTRLFARVGQHRIVKELQELKKLIRQESVRAIRMVWWRRAWWIRVEDGPDSNTAKK